MGYGFTSTPSRRASRRRRAAQEQHAVSGTPSCSLSSSNPRARRFGAHHRACMHDTPYIFHIKTCTQLSPYWIGKVTNILVISCRTASLHMPDSVRPHRCMVLVDQLRCTCWVGPDPARRIRVWDPIWRLNQPESMFPRLFCNPGCTPGGHSGGDIYEHIRNNPIRR